MIRTIATAFAAIMFCTASVGGSVAALAAATPAPVVAQA
jgi:hypothetical protein